MKWLLVLSVVATFATTGCIKRLEELTDATYNEVKGTRLDAHVGEAVKMINGDPATVSLGTRVRSALIFFKDAKFEIDGAGKTQKDQFSFHLGASRFLAKETYSQPMPKIVEKEFDTKGVKTKTYAVELNKDGVVLEMRNFRNVTVIENKQLIAERAKGKDGVRAYGLDFPRVTAGAYEALEVAARTAIFALKGGPDEYAPFFATWEEAREGAFRAIYLGSTILGASSDTLGTDMAPFAGMWTTDPINGLVLASVPFPGRDSVVLTPPVQKFVQTQRTRNVYGQMLRDLWTTFNLQNRIPRARLDGILKTKMDVN